jgi:hypothetical protein
MIYRGVLPHGSLRGAVNDMFTIPPAAAGCHQNNRAQAGDWGAVTKAASVSLCRRRVGWCTYIMWPAS